MKITPQPHIWPGRNLGICFARNAQAVVVSSAVCLDCGWASDWHTTTGPTHQAGRDHVCTEHQLEEAWRAWVATGDTNSTSDGRPESERVNAAFAACPSAVDVLRRLVT